MRQWIKLKPSILLFMRKSWSYLLMVSIVAVPVALFEVWFMTHFRVGWGEPLPLDTVWGKPFLKEIPFNLIDPRLLTRYHFAMFFIVVPALVAESIFLLRCRGAFRAATKLAWAVLMIACVLGVMELEDFLFFVFSSILGTPYPDALKQFLHGRATWYPRLVDFGPFMLPDFYLWLPPIIALLLWVESRLEHAK
jgi:hypothetical protein